MISDFLIGRVSSLFLTIDSFSLPGDAEMVFAQLVVILISHTGTDFQSYTG